MFTESLQGRFIVKSKGEGFEQNKFSKITMENCLSNANICGNAVYGSGSN